MQRFLLQHSGQYSVFLLEINPNPLTRFFHFSGKLPDIFGIGNQDNMKVTRKLY